MAKILPQYDLSCLDDLPEDLRESLSATRTNERTCMIIDLLRDAGRPLSLDELAVSIWRVHGLNLKRTNLCSKMSSLANNKKSIVRRCPHRYGVYELIR